MDPFIELNQIEQTIEFMKNAFPWISLLVLLITVVGVALAEKRKLILQHSGEEERINKLEELDAGQKERLLKAAAPLPQSLEAYPLPDLPQRLVAALCKVSGLLKLVLLLGTGYSLARIASMPNATRSCTHPILWGAFVSLLIALAVLQIWASTQVTRGSNKARRYLLFMAILDLSGIAIILSKTRTCSQKHHTKEKLPHLLHLSPRTIFIKT